MQMITIVRDPADLVANQEAVSWAIQFLAETLGKQSLSAGTAEKTNPGLAGLQLIVAGADSVAAAELLGRAGIAPPSEAEGFVLAKESLHSQTLLLACGYDARGLVYAVLEIADRVRCSSDAVSELNRITLTVEKPANRIRCVSRLFVSEVEDKPWYYDKVFWDEYLTELAIHRFNRFSLTLGMGYDLGHEKNVVDNYFSFTYAFLFALPGYNVSVINLPDEERERNLEMLRYISEQTKRRGLHFQLGLWTHSYYLRESPDLNYAVEGLSSESHAPYVRDALRHLLQVCPAINGLTLRVHYESGIPEPAHEFWKAVMPGIAQAGRTVEIDLHAKGLDDEMIQIAVDTGMPVVVSPKYWGEQMAVPYHQLSIREKEMNDMSGKSAGMWAVTATSRRFTRYGYADFLKEGRGFDILYRVWPATQRVLLWGDPLYAAGYGRDGQFSGSQGMELWEPLSFIGKKGTGVLGGRELYKEPDLQLDGYEWRKYLYTYRLWGRLLYNPQADPESWRRYLKCEFGDAANDCEQALAQASRILPFITVAHTPSPGHNAYWPEMYANVPIVNMGTGNAQDTGYDYDTFGLTSSLDPELFYRVDDYAEDVLNGSVSYKYSPIDSAARLDGWAAAAERHLQQAVGRISDAQSPVFRRFAVDVKAQAGLGRFFARKFRAALSYGLYERTKDKIHLEHAVQQYRLAKEAWQQVATVTDVYREDLSFGNRPYIRGHWADRLTAIEADLAAMEAQMAKTTDGRSLQESLPEYTQIWYSSTAPKLRPAPVHSEPASYKSGADLPLKVTVPNGADDGLRIILRYRHANQAESYEAAEMTRAGNTYSAFIPASYTGSPYPLIYFFELRNQSGDVWLAPGFDEQISNQPYYLIRETQKNGVGRL